MFSLIVLLLIDTYTDSYPEQCCNEFHPSLKFHYIIKETTQSPLLQNKKPYDIHRA